MARAAWRPARNIRFCEYCAGTLLQEDPPDQRCCDNQSNYAWDQQATFGRTLRANELLTLADSGGRKPDEALLRYLARRVDRDAARKYLVDSLEVLGDYARQYNVPLIYEPLNRYETNLCNTISET